jgi:hypothetical protein
VSKHRIFARGLLYHEVAIIKRMRLMGHARDYIFSFILRPGRKLTPACIAEIENGQIGPEVEPATEGEVDGYIARRLSENADAGSAYGPLSSFQISETLGWFSRAQNDLFRDESQQVEFKLTLQSDLNSLLGYAKTLAAFSNNVGGYMFFGVSDERIPVGVDEADFHSFDWDRLSAICREYFQPDVIWDRGVYTWSGKTLGVVYAFEAAKKPTVAARDGKGIARGTIYFRYRGYTEAIALGDFFRMLDDRDEKVRNSAIGSIARIG